MSAKHTPGPWVHNHDWPTGVITAPNARYAPSVATIDVGPHDRNEIAANARLIAAAPDYHRQTDLNIAGLLLLLKAIEEDDPKAELLARVNDLLRENKAVQAKAEGQENGKA